MDEATVSSAKEFSYEVLQNTILQSNYCMFSNTSIFINEIPVPVSSEHLTALANANRIPTYLLDDNWKIV